MAASNPNLLSKRSAALEAAVKNALSVLTGALAAATSTAQTHRVVMVSGWDKNPAVRQAVACYLVALRVCAVNAALKVRAQLTDILTATLPTLQLARHHGLVGPCASQPERRLGRS